MRQSPILERYKTDLRPELLAALTKNEIERGYKPRLPPKPKVKDLAELADRIRQEGPCPVSDRLKTNLAARYAATGKSEESAT